MGASDLAHRAFADAGGLGHHHRRPMGHLMQRVALGQCYHALGQLGTQGHNPLWPRLVTQKTVDAVGYEPLLPAPGTSLRFAGSAHVRLRVEPSGTEKNDRRLGAEVLGGQYDVNSSARIPHIHKFTNIGNLLPDSNVKFYPLAPQVWASLNTRS